LISIINFQLQSETGNRQLKTVNFLSSATPETRQRLLDAAGQVFAARGYRQATVREICRRARANLAAVNYHFRDKEGLYTAVLEDAHRRALEKYPLDSPDYEALPPAGRLRIFIHHAVFKLFDEDMSAQRFKLMAWEMIEPTSALDSLVANIIRPMEQRLRAIIRGLLGPGATDEQIRLCQLSIIGQCLHHRHAQPVIQRLFPDQHYGPEDLARLADHITQFSLQALQGLARAQEGVSRHDRHPQNRL
jgi:TetR/AcrR family transcriptional regulator, regulator of cefoperazone and chloramphenicol sensitivity